jgi:hypothetical protein
MMVYGTQNYCVSGLYPSSDILNTIELTVSEIVSLSVRMRTRGQTSVASLTKN